ncbi:hypothetical protein [Ammoniphilus resinae]|uniref:Uncharacterized protein n=1 Tax=Ammoniphilus resinae TaxID=861532 RepID=A0ABS4GNC1_9BACL|nr:hypothetical protein [Ammoniphilus resinae]MBP1931773.1 hypothetical protein [Ammoniphilus resinae]
MDFSNLDFTYIFIAIGLIGVWFLVKKVKKIIRKIVALAFGLLSLYKMVTWFSLLN